MVLAQPLKVLHHGLVAGLVHWNGLKSTLALHPLAGQQLVLGVKSHHLGQVARNLALLLLLQKVGKDSIAAILTRDGAANV